MLETRGDVAEALSRRKGGNGIRSWYDEVVDADHWVISGFSLILPETSKFVTSKERGFFFVKKPLVLSYCHEPTLSYELVIKMDRWTPSTRKRPIQPGIRILTRECARHWFVWSQPHHAASLADPSVSRLVAIKSWCNISNLQYKSKVLPKYREDICAHSPLSDFQKFKEM